MDKNGRLITTDTLIKMYIVLREHLCDGDVNSPRRANFTVVEMEKITEKIDKFYIG